jgi:hypothetical protein
MYLSKAINLKALPSKELAIQDATINNTPFKSKLGKVLNKVKEPVPRYFESVNQLQGYYSEGEYDLIEVFKYLDHEAYFSQTVHKKLSLLTKSGFEIHSDDDNVKEYLSSRFSLMELQTGVSFRQIINKLAFYLIVSSNAFLIKTRDPNFMYASSYTVDDKEMQPITGYFLVHPTSLKPRYKFVQFMDDGQVKHKLELVQWLYVNKRGIIVTFNPEDVIHFALYKDDGMTFGRPEIIPVIDDIRTLRKMEEDVQLLAYRDLFPLIHYKIEKPEMIDHESGITEMDQARRDMERMVQDGGIATDARHEIQYIGSQGKHMEIRPYLEYFQNRVFSGLGVSAADMGLGDGLSGNTAQSMSKQLLDSVRYIQQELSRQFNESILTELMLQSPFGVNGLKNNVRPSLQFEEIDIEWKIRTENHSADQFTKGVITVDEVRNSRGLKTLSDEELKRTHPHMYGKFSDAAIEAQKEIKSAADKDVIKSSKTNSNVVKSNRDSLDFILDSNISSQLLDVIDRYKGENNICKKFNLRIDLNNIYAIIKSNVTSKFNDGIRQSIKDINAKKEISPVLVSDALSELHSEIDKLCSNVYDSIISEQNINTSKLLKRIDSANRTEQVKGYNAGYALCSLLNDIKEFNLMHYDSEDTLSSVEINNISDIFPSHPNSKTIISAKKCNIKDEQHLVTIPSILKDDQDYELTKKLDPIEQRLEKALLFVKDLSDTVSDIKTSLLSNNNNNSENSEIILAMTNNTNKQIEGFLDTISELKDQNHQLSSKYISAIERILKSIDGISQDNMNSIKSIVDSIPKEFNINSSPIEVNVDNPPMDVNLTVQDQKIEPKKTKKSITIIRDEDGNMTSVNVEENDDEK